ncbi:hypothetical protein KDH_08130 [Dictyobacter sp. S3.2.2.5]|uniref:Uncharacterized protein n=1 Tax=Dictyobacter halimunensis TaxID=3026934 RepID=A0ABQ6FIL2_9CHLR|nr:hypothetical protein KDH_08130 [Dictyobacter sp. S3.2.2.5]
MNSSKTVDIMQLVNDFDKTFADIEKVYRPRFQNVVYCLIGNVPATTEILNEIFSRAYNMLGQCSEIQLKRLNVDQWLCTLALNVTNTWLSTHANLVYDAASLSSLAS